MADNEFLKHRIVIEIDEETDQYSADLTLINRNLVVSVLKDLAKKLDRDEELLMQEGLIVMDNI